MPKAKSALPCLAIQLSWPPNGRHPLAFGVRQRGLVLGITLRRISKLGRISIHGDRDFEGLRVLRFPPATELHLLRHGFLPLPKRNSSFNLSRTDSNKGWKAMRRSSTCTARTPRNLPCTWSVNVPGARRSSLSPRLSNPRFSRRYHSRGDSAKPKPPFTSWTRSSRMAPFDRLDSLSLRCAVTLSGYLFGNLTYTSRASSRNSPWRKAADMSAYRIFHFSWALMKQMTLREMRLAVGASVAYWPASLSR